MHLHAEKVITSFGRPNWPRIVNGVADNHPGQTIGVFVCGPPPFCKSINRACQNFNATAAARIKVTIEIEPSNILAVVTVEHVVRYPSAATETHTDAA